MTVHSGLLQLGSRARCCIGTVDHPQNSLHMEPVRLLIVDPLEMLVEGIRSWLNDTRFVVVGHVRSGDELMALLHTLPCDIVLMEISLSGKDGIDTMRGIHNRNPGQKVLAFSSLTGIEYVNSMLIEGASGYLVKGGSRSEMLDALREIAAGRRYLSEIARKNMEAGYAYTNKHPEGEYIGLSDRERDIIRLIAEERTNSEIAHALFISSDTVKSHRKSLMKKLNVRTAAGIVKYALARKWA